MLPNKLISYIIVAITSLLLGWYLTKNYYSVSQTKTEIREVNHTKTIIVTVKEPNGTEKTTTTIDSETKSQTNTSMKIAKSNKTNISLLASNDFSNSLIKPVYGLSASRELIGPITVGVFGLTNKTIGISIGINF